MANTLEGMVLKPPHPQNAFDLFHGEWAYDIPVADTKTGGGTTFRQKHYSVWQAQQTFGSLEGMTCLELGPNEGEVSFHLHHAKCRSVTAIEARVRAYLKCLIVKNQLHLNSVHYQLGDFIDFLERTQEHFDFCMAAGVLYHMPDPIRFLELLTLRADRIAIASHYFNDGMLKYKPDHDNSGLGPAIWNFVPKAGELHAHGGISANYYKYHYTNSVYVNETFAHGGPKPFANMLRKDDIIRVLQHFGMTIVGEVNDDPNGPRGAHVFLIAQRA